MNIIEIGKNVKQPEGFKAFIPNPFPPRAGFSFEGEIFKKNEQATKILGELNGITKLLPDSDFFLLMYLRKDAASSSQIEGTKATMIDAIEAEAKINTNIPEDVDDILHYIKALNYGLKRVKVDKFPISLRFIKELHQQLMKSARATHFSDPGEFRKSQNWIGGIRPDNAKFVPPSVPAMKDSLSDLEKFLYQDDNIPVIIKTGIVHAQFETIHPFLDGNGRTGRMLIIFYLWDKGFLEKPVLFLSSFFKKHQKLYYDKLFNYHNGEVSDWVEFFLDGVIEVASEAISMIKKISKLKERDYNKIRKFSFRAFESADIVLNKLYRQPIINVALVQKWTGFTRAGAGRVIDRFIEAGILVPKNNDKKYGQSYIYKEYLDIFYSNY